MHRVLPLIAAALASAQAQAAVITVNGQFTASDWGIYFNPPGWPDTAREDPIDPLFLDFSVTFDNELSYEADDSVIEIHSTNIPYPFTFSYAPDSFSFTLATLGFPFACGHPASSFCAFFIYSDPTPVSFAGPAMPLSGPTFTATATFVQQTTPNGTGWIANTIRPGLPGGGGVIPEPATWAMLIAGFGLIGTALRRRRAAAPAAA